VNCACSDLFGGCSVMGVPTVITDPEGIPEQGKWLGAVVTGYMNYHAVPTNSRSIVAFGYHVKNLWRRTLRRRSQKDGLTFERMDKIAAAYLPRPRILHPWPSTRFAVKHPRWEPSA
jgi:RNA-directed DNA polymerase